MRELATFLEPRLEEIAQRWSERVTAGPAVDALPAPVLREHLEGILVALRHALREGAVPGSIPAARRHGQRHHEAGFPADALVRQYRALRGLLLDFIEGADPGPPPGQVRLVSDFLFAAIAEGVVAYDRRRSDGPQAQAAAEAERQRMTQLAARLRASEENQRRVLDASGAGLWELHFASGSIAADERMVELMGLPPGSSFTLASSLTGHVLPADRERVGVAVRAAMAGENDGHYFVEFRTGGHGGAPLRWVESRARVTFDARGQATHLGGAMIDITARRVAEEAQRTSDERYRTLFNSIDEGFCLIEVLGGAPGQPLDYRFLEVNHAFEQQTGLEDAEGRTMRELNPRHEEHWFEIYARVAATGEAVRFVNEASALGRWFDVHASRLGSVEKRQVAVLFKDITAQQLAAQERERLLARESEARREAEEANRLKDEFLATVSHELRTPLTSMLGWLHLLRTGALPADHRRTALETIERNARAQAQLVEDLLDMSRILSGRLRLELEPIEVAAVVEAALDTVRPTAEARGVRLQSVLDAGGLVMGDPNRLQQIVWNLLANAVKFTPKGGRVHTTVQCLESSVEIVVSDTGQGITPGFLPHVFERFRQADGGIARVQGGLGLGLSIVRQLVETLGGTVSVASPGEGQGATFTVRLPVAVARRESVAPPGPLPWREPAATVPRGELAGLLLLVVDDDGDARDMLAILLEASGARVRLASSAAEGRELFAAERPDVVVSDIGMAGENGHALIESLRRLPPGQGGDVPAVALTAYARSEDRTRALKAGFSSHVAKPVEPAELVAVIATLARHARVSPA